LGLAYRTNRAKRQKAEKKQSYLREAALAAVFILRDQGGRVQLFGYQIEARSGETKRRS